MNKSGMALDLADYELHYGADSMALHDTLPAGERVIVAFGENTGAFGRIVALPAGLEDAVWMQNTLVLPDRGGIVSVSHASGAEIDAMVYGDFYGLPAGNAYLADTLLDSMSRRSSLKSVQRASYGGASEREGSVGDIDPGLQTERSEQAEVGSFYLNRGRKVYELKNHLGNVLAVVSDVKLGVSTSSLVDYYIADVVEMTDYEPFGMELAGRHWVSSARYRYGFQGQEGDDEWSGEGNMLAFKYRVHDVRLGRFLSIDPLAPKYPWNSSYTFSEDRVIDGIEVEGLEVQLIRPAEYHPDYTMGDNAAVGLQRFVAGVVNAGASALQYGGEVIFSGGEKLHEIPQQFDEMGRQFDRDVAKGVALNKLGEAMSDPYNWGQATIGALPFCEELSMRCLGQSATQTIARTKLQTIKLPATKPPLNPYRDIQEIINTYPEEIQNLITNKNFGPPLRKLNGTKIQSTETISDGILTSNLWSIEAAPDAPIGTTVSNYIANLENMARVNEVTNLRVNILQITNESMINRDYAKFYGLTLESSYSYTISGGKQASVYSFTKKVSK